MAKCVKEWYPDGITCLQVYGEFHNKYFGAINGVDIDYTYSRTKEDTERLLEEYYNEVYNSD